MWYLVPLDVRLYFRWMSKRPMIFRDPHPQAWLIQKSEILMHVDEAHTCDWVHGDDGARTREHDGGAVWGVQHASSPLPGKAHHLNRPEN